MLPEWATVWVETPQVECYACHQLTPKRKPQPGRICDTCGKPYVPKHPGPEYSTCQPCHYGWERHEDRYVYS